MLPEWFDLLGVMRWPLAFCAVLSLTICLERLVFMAGCAARGRAHLDRLTEQLTRCKHQPKQVRDDAVAMMLDDIRRAYLAGVDFLRVIGAVSPLLGLLGTIFGVIAAFRVIAAHTGPVSPNMIAAGLWEALLTTAAGLLIALPTLLLAHGFRFFGERQIDAMRGEMNRRSMALELEAKA